MDGEWRWGIGGEWMVTSPPAYRPPPLHEWRWGIGGEWRWGIDGDLTPGLSATPSP